MKKLLLALLLILAVSLVAVSCKGADDTTASNGEETTTEKSMEDTTVTEEITTEETTTEETTEETTAEITTEAEIEKKPFSESTIAFLGSSVTYGSASGGTSFVEFIRSQTRCTVIKEAVSGTTLVDNGSSSYVQRMVNNIDPNASIDHLVVQLSTNDATQNKALGRLSSSTDLGDFNTATIIGAIEYIVCYAKETWGCDVTFYTGTKYESVLYQKMVTALYDVQEKWGIGIIDLWNDEEMNAVSEAEYARYMSDPIHPTLTGYRTWWTPKFIEHLEKYFTK